MIRHLFKLQQVEFVDVALDGEEDEVNSVIFPDRFGEKDDFLVSQQLFCDGSFQVHQ